MKPGIFMSLMALLESSIFLIPTQRVRLLRIFLPRGFRAPTGWHLTGAATYGPATEPQAKEESGK
jgi:hypothetical protein